MQKAVNYACWTLLLSGLTADGREVATSLQPIIGSEPLASLPLARLSKTTTRLCSVAIRIHSYRAIATNSMLPT